MSPSRPGLREPAATGAVQRRTRSAVRHGTHSVQWHNPAHTVQRGTTHVCSAARHTLNGAAQHARCSTARHAQSRAVRRTELCSTARKAQCTAQHNTVQCSAHRAARHNTRNVVQCAAQCSVAQHTKCSVPPSLPPPPPPSHHPPPRPTRGTAASLPPPPPQPAAAAGGAQDAWPADMQSRRDSHRAPPGRPVSLKIGLQIKSNQIPATPPPLPRGLKRRAARKGLGGARDGGPGVPPHTLPQNDPPRRAAGFEARQWTASACGAVRGRNVRAAAVVVAWPHWTCRGPLSSRRMREGENSFAWGGGGRLGPQKEGGGVVWAPRKREGGVVWAPRKREGGSFGPPERGRGGLEKGLKRQSPLCKESPWARKLGRQAAQTDRQTENVVKILCPIDMYLQTISASWGIVLRQRVRGYPRTPVPSPFRTFLGFPTFEA